MADASAGIKLLNPSELVTLAGAVTAVFFIAQGTRHVFGLNPKITGFSASAILSFLGAWMGSDHSLAAWVAAVPNSFIIYSASVGFAAVTGRNAASRHEREAPKGSDPDGHPTEEVSNEREFWRTWY